VGVSSTAGSTESGLPRSLLPGFRGKRQRDPPHTILSEEGVILTSKLKYPKFCSTTVQVVEQKFLRHQRVLC
jgi:hypothetical protein